MAGTPLPSTTRHIEQGTREFLWVPVGGIANIQSPTHAELDAGTNLTGEIADYSGFSMSADTVDAPDLGSLFVAQLAGQVKAADSSLVIYAESGPGARRVTDVVRSRARQDPPARSSVRSGERRRPSAARACRRAGTAGSRPHATAGCGRNGRSAGVARPGLAKLGKGGPRRGSA